MSDCNGGNDSPFDFDGMMYYLISGSAGADLDDEEDEEPMGNWNIIREFGTSIEIESVDRH
jgi:hypothetical protein